MLLRRLIVASLCGLAPFTASATILTFDIDLPPAQGGQIPQAYGDNVSSLVQIDGLTTYTYGLGNGLTPNVTTSYASNGTGSVLFWSTGYGDLIDNAWTAGGVSGEGADDTGEITFTPAAGWQVRLNSFDIACWQPSCTTANNQLRTLEVLVDGLVVLDFIANGTTSVTDLTHDTFAVDLTSSESITLRWEPGWHLGVDNINFDQVAVPLPAAAPLLGSALLGFAAWRRRRPAAS